MATKWIWFAGTMIVYEEDNLQINYYNKQICQSCYIQGKCI